MFAICLIASFGNDLDSGWRVRMRCLNRTVPTTSFVSLWNGDCWSDGNEKSLDTRSVAPEALEVGRYDLRS